MSMESHHVQKSSVKKKVCVGWKVVLRWKAVTGQKAGERQKMAAGENPKLLWRKSLHFVEGAYGMGSC
jgi:hypothetical protein